MVVSLLEKPLTLEEFLDQEETTPATEYIEGEIIQKPMPQTKHSIIQGELVTVINSVAKSKKIAIALPELRCTFGGKSIVPDIVVLTYNNIPRDENGDVANMFYSYPDWMIEILSPQQSQSQLVKKILRCLDSGCQLSWLIDPEEKTIFVYYPDHKIACFEIETDILPTPQFLSELNLKLGDIFAWLKI